MIPCDKSMKAIVLRILALIGMLSTTACARAAEPWDAPFAGDPRAILEAAKLIPVPDEQMAQSIGWMGKRSLIRRQTNTTRTFSPTGASFGRRFPRSGWEL